MAAVIEARGLTKRYGSVLALDELTLDVAAGEVFGFLGPNGAGKTTTVRLLLGLLRPSAGAVQVLGADAWTDAVALHRRLAYVPGEFAVWPNLTGADMLELLGSLHGPIDAAYRDALIGHFDFDPSKKGRSYSKGNRQKIGLIAALMTRAELLVLDEPTAGLDPLMEIRFREAVVEARGRGQSVFLSSHILSEVEAVCDRVAILRKGRLVDVGTLDELRHLSANRVEATFAGPVPDLSGVAGVSDVTVHDHSVRLQVRGDPNGLLRFLARCDVVAFSSQVPSLEEVFLAHYGAEEPDTGAADEAAP